MPKTLSRMHPHIAVIGSFPSRTAASETVAEAARHAMILDPRHRKPEHLTTISVWLLATFPDLFKPWKAAIKEPVTEDTVAGHAQLMALASKVQFLRHSAGTLLYRQGEAGDSLYVVIKGRVGIWQEGTPASPCAASAAAPPLAGAGAALSSSTGKLGLQAVRLSSDQASQLGVRLAVVHPGGTFGELSVEHSTSRLNSALVEQEDAGTSVDVAATDLLFVPGELYRSVMRPLFDPYWKKLDSRVNCLKSLPFGFSSWEALDLLVVCYWLEERVYREGQTLYREGTPNTHVHILLEGVVLLQASLTLQLATRPAINAMGTVAKKPTPLVQRRSVKWAHGVDLGDESPRHDQKEATVRLEAITSPGMVGFVDVLMKREIHPHTAFAHGGPARVLTLSASLFKTLFMTKATDNDAKSVNELWVQALATDRWHNVRMDAEGMANIPLPWLTSVRNDFIASVLDTCRFELNIDTHLRQRRRSITLDERPPELGPDPSRGRERRKSLELLFTLGGVMEAESKAPMVISAPVGIGPAAVETEEVEEDAKPPIARTTTEHPYSTSRLQRRRSSTMYGKFVTNARASIVSARRFTATLRFRLHMSKLLGAARDRISTRRRSMKPVGVSVAAALGVPVPTDDDDKSPTGEAAKAPDTKPAVASPELKGDMFRDSPGPLARSLSRRRPRSVRGLDTGSPSSPFEIGRAQSERRLPLNRSLVRSGTLRRVDDSNPGKVLDAISSTTNQLQTTMGSVMRTVLRDVNAPSTPKAGTAPLVLPGCVASPLKSPPPAKAANEPPVAPSTAPSLASERVKRASSRALVRASASTRRLATGGSSTRSLMTAGSRRRQLVPASLVATNSPKRQGPTPSPTCTPSDIPVSITPSDRVTPPGTVSAASSVAAGDTPREQPRSVRTTPIVDPRSVLAKPLALQASPTKARMPGSPLMSARRTPRRQPDPKNAATLGAVGVAVGIPSPTKGPRPNTATKALPTLVSPVVPNRGVDESRAAVTSPKAKVGLPCSPSGSPRTPTRKPSQRGVTKGRSTSKLGTPFKVYTTAAAAATSSPTSDHLLPTF